MHRRCLLILLACLAAALCGRSRPALAASVVTVSYPPGWNLVGGPAGTRLSGATGSLYTLQYRDRGYESLPASSGLTGGLGYWAYFPNGGSADLGDPAPCVVAVPIGAAEWVMVGDPSPSGTASIRGEERVYTYGPDTGYIAGNVPGVTIHPGQAAWAYSSVATTVAIVQNDCPGANSVPPSPPIPPP